MKVTVLRRDEIVLALSRDELRIIGNALNEVCNALDIEEFATRMGAEPEEARELLTQLNAANDRMAES